MIAPAKTPANSIARQLELTINALARSMRKAIRLAEKEMPALAGGPWEIVEHRAKLLQEMLSVAAEYAKSQVAPQPAPTAPANPAAGGDTAGVQPTEAASSTAVGRATPTNAGVSHAAAMAAKLTPAHGAGAATPPVTNHSGTPHAAPRPQTCLRNGNTTT